VTADGASSLIITLVWQPDRPLAVVYLGDGPSGEPEAGAPDGIGSSVAASADVVHWYTLNLGAADLKSSRSLMKAAWLGPLSNTKPL
jgi:hypothetical protein